MKKSLTLLNNAPITLCTILFLVSQDIFARAGGGGGGHSSGGGGHSSGGSGFYSGGGSGGGGSLNTGTVIIIIVGVVIYLYLKKNGKLGGNSDGVNEEIEAIPDQAFPEGLDKQKVENSFLSIQDAWQKKDLKNVRKWVSDGVYQRFNAQFEMMNKLQQTNKLTNIKIDGIKLANTAADGHYHTADVAIGFTMDDEFLSEKYPSFNQKFNGESAMEYWTFIKRNDAKAGKNLYDNNNCPNCGATFDVSMGEISRCSACGTLTNNASYDWVLSEITQEGDYFNTNFTKRAELLELTKNDNLFSVQRIEDVASNVFMQTMEVISGAPEKKLSRFADAETTKSILETKKRWGNFVFDRLYLNDVDLVDFNTKNERLNLDFLLKVTYQRVEAGQNIKLIDSDMVTKVYTLTLSKNLKALQTPEKETVFSYECTNCGAPYTDTTNDVCQYCSAPLIDFNKNWVLTFFR
jgi:DNA-directed RNA polymerase subunit RPC12/RpoP